MIATLYAGPAPATWDLTSICLALAIWIGHFLLPATAIRYACIPSLRISRGMGSIPASTAEGGSPRWIASNGFECECWFDRALWEVRVGSLGLVG